MKYVNEFSVEAKAKNEDELIEAFSDLDCVIIKRGYRRLIAMDVVEIWFKCMSDYITPEDIGARSKRLKCIPHLYNIRET